MKIGILALQGAFAEHAKVLDQLGVESVEIRNLDDFQKHQSDLSGLILPGGESTTMGKLLRDQNMLIPIREAILSGLPAFGTCAGLILLAKEITSQEESHLGTMDMVGVEILARVDDQIVAAQEKNMLVTSFHPELTDDVRLHQYFINMCDKKIVE